MMNTRGHLPAGQQVQSGADMGPVPAAGGPGSGRGGRPQHYVPPHHHHHHHYHQQPAIVGQSMYPGYMAPMANAYTAAPYYVHHQPYSNGAMPSPAYMPYPPSTGYARSPPSMQHYHVPLPQTYPRLAQHSPIVSSPYHVPPPPVPTTIPLPHTPSSTHSHVVLPPMTPPVQQVHEMVQRPESAQTLQHPEPEREPQPHPESQPVAQPEQGPSQQHSVPQAQQSPTRSLPLHNEPFRPPVRLLFALGHVECLTLIFLQLPWLSVPDAPFPSRASKLRRRKLLGADAERLELPNQHNPVAEASSAPRKDVAADEKQDHKSETRQQAVSTPQPESNTTNETLPARSETPSTQDQPSEDTVSTSPTTPSSVQQPQSTPTTAVKPVAQSTVSAVPAVPVIPALPKAGPKEPKPAGGAENSSGDAKGSADAAGSVSGETPADSSAGTAEATTDAVPSAPAPPKPKLWTGLFAKPAPAASQSSATVTFKTNGDAAAGTSSTSGAGSGFAKANASSLAEALEAYRPGAQDKLVFVEPRGLVNTGNMCYMNSVRAWSRKSSHMCV
jgi:ubiquitin carboxyl-terminal hydrolase 10